ncbi:unnamed protein product [Rhizoctonia solani]|uniref:Uncharacterized protein n=1 Tax=Rhizoctonia solani TaxID=456999 RepID=A0A8H3BFY7_9AGAM|nr:unnamed protein product [Rhizoctonia solani]
MPLRKEIKQSFKQAKGKVKAVFKPKVGSSWDMSENIVVWDISDGKKLFGTLDGHSDSYGPFNHSGAKQYSHTAHRTPKTLPSSCVNSKVSVTAYEGSTAFANYGGTFAATAATPSNSAPQSSAWPHCLLPAIIRPLLPPVVPALRSWSPSTPASFAGPASRIGSALR